MACSLDDLLTFCVGEIAISGERGIDPKDIPTIVHKFYDASRQNASSAGVEPIPAFRRRSLVVDEPFLHQFWTWLTKHPDVYVGSKKEGNHLSFSEVQSRNSKHANRQRDSQSDQAGDNANDPDRPDADHETKLRVYVSEERMWLAVCGHPPDSAKVQSMEFTLLSLIASRRGKGILQGDLVRLSGQDKRSVPKRTDSLREKGYIEKRPVLAKGSRTSLLTLKKFAGEGQMKFDSLGKGKFSGADAGESLHYFDITVLIQRLFEILEKRTLITTSDLKQQLGLSNKLQWKMLSRLIRRFEASGAVKRVKAASKHSANEKWRYLCVKFLRPPTKQEIERYCTVGGGSSTKDDDPDSDAEGEEDDEDVPETLHGPDILLSSSLEEVGRILPAWNPDRLLMNQLAEVIHAAGTKGLTQSQMQHSVFGPFVSRPLEFLLSRLVENWTLTQPAHLRHLSIIRDTALAKTAVFLHYSFPHFQKLVDEGTAFWEAVIVTGKGKVKANEMIQSLVTPPDLDAFGFPVTLRPANQYQNGWASLGEVIKSVNAPNWHLTNLDPVVVEVDGQDQIAYGKPMQRGQSTASENLTHRLPSPSVASPRTPRTKRQNASATPHRDESESQPRPRVYQEGRKRTGRPRKYERGMEAFWRLLGKRLLRSRGLNENATAVMKHPLVIQMIESRPQEFDDTYLRAVDSGAPVPLYPVDLNSGWVEGTKGFLDRKQDGVYISPMITLGPEFTNNNRYKRLVIVKSSRLQECSFSPGRTVADRRTPVVQFLTSSRAHTHLIPRTIPSSIFGGVLPSLMPTSTPFLRKPPAPPLPAAPLPVEYLPSIAAHTIPHLRSIGQTNARPKLNRHPRTISSRPLADPQAKRQKSSSNKAATSPGPRLGLFDAITQQGLDNLRASPSSPDVPTARSSLYASKFSLSVAQESGRQGDDVSMQSIDDNSHELDAPDRRNLRSVKAPSAKQLETLEQAPISRQGKVTQRYDFLTERSILKEDEDMMMYLNSPSHTFPRSTNPQSMKARRIAGKASGTPVKAVIMGVSSTASTPDRTRTPDVRIEWETQRSVDGEQDEVSSAPHNDGASAIHSPNRVEEPPQEPEAMQRPTDPSKLTDILDGDHNEDADDSDVTVDLGPDKFLLTSRERPKSQPLANSPAPKPPRNTVAEERNDKTSPASDRQSHPPPTETDRRISVPLAAVQPSPQASPKPTEKEAPDVGRSTIDIIQTDVNRSDLGAGEVVDSSVPAQVPIVLQDNRKPPIAQPKRKGRVDVWGGSIGFFRRKIILDVIDKCGGVIPFASPLWYVFATAWKRSGRSTKPDKRTIRYAVKALIDAGQVKQLKFAFKDSRGLMTTQAMLARTHINVSDPIVRQLQKDIIDAYPRPYQPDEFVIDTSLRLHDSGPTGVYKHPEVDDREIVQTEHKPASLIKAEKKEEEKRKHAELRDRIQTNQVIRPTPLANVPIAPKPPRVARLERIGGPHRLITRKPNLNFNLPSSERIVFSTTVNDAVSFGSNIETVTSKQFLNDRKRRELPHSLADVPDRRRKKIDDTQPENPAYSKFISDVEKVERWEALKPHLFDSSTPEDWQFINHHLSDTFQEAQRYGTVDFGAWSWFDEDGEEIIAGQPPDFALHKQGPRSAVFQPETPTGRRRRRKVAEALIGDGVSITGDQTPQSPSIVDSLRPSRKRKYLGSLQDPRPTKLSRTERRVEKLQGDTFDPNILFPDGKPKATRRPQHLRQMPEELLYRLLVTFAVVRVLVGGVEKYIDWSIVNQIFPDETEQFLKDRWKTIRLKYRHVIRQYQDDFQELFLKAYENGELPHFDYDDVANNEWEAIIDWAMTVLERPIKHDVDDLPVSRAEFDQYQKIQVEPPTQVLRDCYAYNTNVTLSHRENAVSAMAFAVPVISPGREDKENMLVPSDAILSPLTQPIKPAKSALDTVARSWALATVLTPVGQKSGTAANAKISTLPNYNKLLEEAVKALTTGRVLTNSNKTKLHRVASKMSNRMYDVSQHFLNALSEKKIINRAMLRRAMWYKLHVLDPAFTMAAPRKIMFDMHRAEDGDMVAVLSLVASGRVIIRPSSSNVKGERVPTNRYGLIDSYQTRFMDKAAFHFAVELECSPKYKWIAGNPLTSQKAQAGREGKQEKQQEKSLTEVFPVPRGGMDLPLPESTTSQSGTSMTPARIPLYFSIHGEFLSWVWEMLVAAITGVLTNRPGMSTEEIFNMLHPAVDMEDIRLVLPWMQEVGAVKMREGKLGGAYWEVNEWWWCVCDLTIGVDGAGVQELDEHDTPGEG